MFSHLFLHVQNPTTCSPARITMPTPQVQTTQAELPTNNALSLLRVLSPNCSFYGINTVPLLNPGLRAHPLLSNIWLMAQLTTGTPNPHAIDCFACGSGCRAPSGLTWSLDPKLCFVRFTMGTCRRDQMGFTCGSRQQQSPGTLKGKLAQLLPTYRPSSNLVLQFSPSLEHATTLSLL